MPIMPTTNAETTCGRFDDEPPAGPRQPRWLIPGAVALCASGVLLGVLLAAGTFIDDGEAKPTTRAATDSLSTIEPAATSAAPTAPVSPTPAPVPPYAAQPTQPTTPPTSTPPLSPTAPHTSFPLLPNEPLPKDVWLVRSVASSLCLDLVPGPAEGADVQQVECDSGTTQQWRADINSSTITLVNVASGKCLEVESLSSSDGAAVQQWTCNGSLNQEWTLLSLGGGKFSLVAMHSGKCLELSASATAVGAKAQQSICDGGADQLWTSR